MSGIFRWFSDTVVNVVSVTYVSVRNFIFGEPNEVRHPEEPNEVWYPEDVNEVNVEANNVPRIEQVQSRRLLGNAIAHYEIQNHTSTSPTDFLNNARGLVTNFFRDNPNNKFQISLLFVVVKVDAQGSIVAEEETGRSSKQEVVLPATNVDEVYNRMRDKIIESYMRNGSGWRLKRVVKLLVTKTRLNPLRGSSHIPLAVRIKNKKALINIKNKDDKCFKYAVTRALNQVDDKAERVSKELKEQTKKYNWSGIEFPTPCCEKQFRKFEENNVSIIVFGHEGDKIIPLYVPRGRRETTVRLFFQRSKDGTEQSLLRYKEYVEVSL